MLKVGGLGRLSGSLAGKFVVAPIGALTCFRAEVGFSTGSTLLSTLWLYVFHAMGALVFHHEFDFPIALLLCVPSEEATSPTVSFPILDVHRICDMRWQLQLLRVWIGPVSI